ncbi:AAA family ATPase [Capnocytophaga sputigena]|uniref:AAA family ATPase n=1 Tax=Capnocytophaga sputigena TaxID=1019 RepID=UPI0031F5A2FA
MINLHIQNFKCFKKTEIPINQLTVLAGGNGNGKSSVIQALLLLRRTLEKEEENIELNGAYCLNLGNSYNLNSGTETMMFVLKENDKELRVSYEKGEVIFNIISNRLRNTYQDNPLSFREFYYLNAERIGPRISQPLNAFLFPNTGFQGEYTAQVIKELDNKGTTFKVDDARILNDENYNFGALFVRRVNAWLAYILDGITVEAYIDKDTHTSRLEVENAFSKGNPTSPTNTGFGISYVLPIIVTCLLAEKDRLVIIENPEAHLHPAAQSKIGYFLAKMASAGLRIVVETHSDHIINGIQLAVAKKEIESSSITINYFDKGEQQPEVHPISMNEKGELDKWPKGFFDQTQIDFAELIKLRRNV